MARSPILPAAGLARLFRHSTTIDPYLDESGPSARRLGAIALDGVSYDALDLSAPGGLRVEFRTAAPSLLHVPCALVDAPRGSVRVEAAVTPREGETVSKLLQIGADGWGRWHVLTFAVPRGTVTLTIAASDEDGHPICGVPLLVWRKSMRAVSRSLAFAVRSLGFLGTIRYVRRKMELDYAGDYAAWLARHALTPARLADARAAAAALTTRPRVALLLETSLLAELTALTNESLAAQVYADWEVWPVENASARNHALAQTRADFVGAIRAGDRLSPLALLRAAEHATAGVDVLYTDEDHWPAGGDRRDPRFKPDWSPALLQACMYPGRLFLVRREVAIAAGGYREGLDGALDYDLALRVCIGDRGIVHIPDVLYHRHAGARGHADSEHPAAATALADACAASGMSAAVVPGALAGVWRARTRPSSDPRISIVLPTDGRGPDGAEPFIVQCVRAITQRTAYANYDLLICDNGNLTAEALAALAAVPHRRITYTWEGAFNFPRKLNFAVRHADAPYLLLLNDDVEPINGDWLDAMLEYAHQPQIGAVGAKLFYPDGRLQHVGVAVGVCGVAAHLLHQHPGGSQGCGGLAVTPRECAAVTGACLLTRRAIYDEAGGFDEALALDFNDVDFCLKLRAAGYRIVFTPHARLFHHESGSFGQRQQRAGEIDTMRRRWRAVLERDPYYNVNFSRAFTDCRLADGGSRS